MSLLASIENGVLEEREKPLEGGKFDCMVLMNMMNQDDRKWNVNFINSCINGEPRRNLIQKSFSIFRDRDIIEV